MAPAAVLAWPSLGMRAIGLAAVATLPHFVRAGNMLGSMEAIKDGEDKTWVPKTNDYDEFVKKDLSECSCVKDGCQPGDQTIVTMLISIHRPGRSLDDYILKFKRLLTIFPRTPIVGFVQQGYAEELVKAHPHPLANTLCLIETTVFELPEYSHVQKYAADLLLMYGQAHTFKFPETIDPVYDALTNSKTALVHRVVNHNPFNSTRFAWLDGGLHWPMTASLPFMDLDISPTDNHSYCLSNFCDVDDRHLDIMTCGDDACIGFNHPVKNCKEDDWRRKLGGGTRKGKMQTTYGCWNCQMGATFTGTKQAMLNLANATRAMLTEYHDQHVVDADQGLMTQIWLNGGPVKDVQCKGFQQCPGFMLGAWRQKDLDLFVWADSDCEGECADDGPLTVRKNCRASEETAAKLLLL